MYTDEQLEELEYEERTLTEETIAIMLVILADLGANLENELRKFYQKYGKDGKITLAEARKWVNSENRRRRIFALFAITDYYFLITLEKLEKEFEKVLRKVAELESKFFDTDIDVEKILDTKWGADDLLWLYRLRDNNSYYHAKLYSELKTAMVRNESIEDVIEMLEKVLDTYSKSTDRLVMTESTTIGSLSRKQIMKEKGVKKYRFYTMEDERTCELCVPLHGRIFPLSQFEIGVTASPIHPRCRCFEIPIITED